jgi:hypothetical protein
VRSAARGPGDSSTALSWKARGLLVLLIRGGWSWLPLNLPGRLIGFYEAQRKSARYGALANLAGDAHAAFGRAVFTPESISALTGIAPHELEAATYCATAWTDRPQVFLRPTWLWQRTPATGWLNVTVSGMAVIGRYSMTLQPEKCRPGSLHTSECTKVDDLRLEERHVPSPTTDDWIVILPGQCVLGQIPAAEPSVVGRYAIDLPADRDVTVTAYTLPATIFVESHLFHGGEEVAAAPGERVVYRTKKAGTYLLTLISTTDSDFSVREGQYSLQVYWGRAIGKRCPIPAFDKRDCYRASGERGRR